MKYKQTNTHPVAQKICIALACVLVATAIGTLTATIIRNVNKVPSTPPTDDGIPDEPSTLPVLDTNAFYLVGTMNGWAWTSDKYKFISTATDQEDVTSQYKLTIALEEGTEVKVWRGDGNWGFSNFENSSESFTTTDASNLQILQAGSYDFYLKFYASSYNSVYVCETPTEA